MYFLGLNCLNLNGSVVLLMNYLGVAWENITMGKVALGNIPVCVYHASKNHFFKAQEIVDLLNLHGDTLKYGYTDAFGYNKRKSNSIFEASLMDKCMCGEKTE